MNKSKTFALALVLTASFLATGALAYEDVAGAGPYSEPTPVLTATPLPTLNISPSGTPLATVTPSASPIPVNEGGFMNWLTDPANLVWLGLAALVIVILSVYLSRRKKSQGQSQI